MMNIPAYLQRHAAWACLSGGALTTLSLAPFNLWPASIITVAIFAATLHQQATQKIFWLSWLFGIGLFGGGVSWVYVSIHDYGDAPVWLASFLTTLFVVFLAFVFALPFLAWGKWFSGHTAGFLLAFPALWVLGEWLRSWLLTGFPWLYLGYAHITSPLAGWLPVTGVYGASFIVAFTGCALAHYLLNDRLNPLVYSICLFVCGYGLHTLHWTQVRYDSPISIGIVQPDFALQDKWNPAKRAMIRQTLEVMSQPLWQQDVILWPEAALSELYQDALPFLDTLDAHGKNTRTTLITGIPYYDAEASRQEQHTVYYNSITALGYGKGLYHKVRLVPFGEYVPLENWLRGIIRFFDLPMSEFSAGPAQQDLLSVGRWHVAPFICYEIVYPDLVAHNARNADFLVTISNDSWFGHSIGPLQHLQMAQARALETQRFLLRGTNDGVSAIIDAQGLIQQSSQRFSPELLSGTIYPVTGQTPFMRFGSTPLMAMLCLLLAGIYATGRWRPPYKRPAHKPR
jgi:apolipoprotein N-acyltransferase